MRSVHPKTAVLLLSIVNPHCGRKGSSDSIGLIFKTVYGFKPRASAYFYKSMIRRIDLNILVNTRE